MTAPTPDAMPDEVLEAMTLAIYHECDDPYAPNHARKGLQAALTAAASMGWRMRDERASTPDNQRELRYRKALAFYANQENYKGPVESTVSNASAVIYDNGFNARQALESKSTEQGE